MSGSGVWQAAGGGGAYGRVPIGIMFPLGIALGGAYIVLLPFAIVGTAIWALGGRILGIALGPATESASFGWRPGEAYLAGDDTREKKDRKTE